MSEYIQKRIVKETILKHWKFSKIGIQNIALFGIINSCAAHLCEKFRGEMLLVSIRLKGFGEIRKEITWLCLEK